MRDVYKSLSGERLIKDRYEEILRDWPTEHRREYVETRHGTTHVVVSGKADKPPLVLLHGSGANSFRWMADLPTWVPHFEVFALDLLGEPGLSAQNRPPLDSAAYAEWLSDALDELNLGPVHLLGESLGGWMALDLAIRQPDRVASLTLICPAGIGKARTLTMLKVLPYLLLGKWGSKKAMSIMLGKAAMKEMQDAAPQVTEFMTLISKHFIYQRSPIPIRTDSELKGLQMPVLLIMGEEDTMIDAQATRQRLAQNAGDATIHMLPDLGHLLPDTAEDVAEFVLTCESRMSCVESPQP